MQIPFASAVPTGRSQGCEPVAARSGPEGSRPADVAAQAVGSR
jgi:hypothetical protein